jgi:hypothetical protein
MVPLSDPAFATAVFRQTQNGETRLGFREDGSAVIVSEHTRPDGTVEVVPVADLTPLNNTPEVSE